MKHYKKVLVAIDLSEVSERVLKKAADIADGATLNLIYVSEPLTYYYSPEFGVDLAPVQQALHSKSEQLLQKMGDRVKIPKSHQHVAIGKPAAQIRQLAERLEADLIVIGTHGRRGLQRLLGSTANDVLHGAPCDVLAVRIGE